MADLKTEGASLEAGSSKMRRAPDHLAQPLSAFRAASHDLSALGVLGSLLGAQGKIREGMDDLVKIVDALGAEYGRQAAGLHEVGEVLTEVDTLLAGEMSTRRE